MNSLEQEIIAGQERLLLWIMRHARHRAAEAKPGDAENWRLIIQRITALRETNKQLRLGTSLGGEK
tara:strand:- start:224 stop:421 length:198 start_codon:yes stop_codon:yes gene_type:complete